MMWEETFRDMAWLVSPFSFPSLSFFSAKIDGMLLSQIARSHIYKSLSRYILVN